jgi:hypothetical protein
MNRPTSTKYVWDEGDSGRSHGRTTKAKRVAVGEVVSLIQQYRDSHHRIAQMFAMGCTPAFIRQHTGISMRRLSLYWSDPSFQELIAHYSKQAEEILNQTQETYVELLSANMLRAEQTVADHFEQAEDEGELIPIQVADRISQGRADRLGFGKNMTIEHKHDFATLLDKAIARSDRVKLIEAIPETEALVGNGAPDPTPPRALRSPLGEGGKVKGIVPVEPEASPQPIRRRRIVA